MVSQSDCTSSVYIYLSIFFFIYMDFQTSMKVKGF